MTTLESPLPVYKIMKQNWLTSKPNSLSGWVAAFFTAFIMMMSHFYWNDFFAATNWMAATGEEVLQKGEYWRAWTTVFVHGDAKHLLSNSFFFFIFASLIYGYFGFWLFPAAAFLFGGLINLIVLHGMPSTTQLVGASGVVFWMGGFWLMMAFFIDRRRGILHRSLKTLGISFVLFFPSEAFNPTTSYKAHLIGFFMGILFGLGIYGLFKKTFQTKDHIETIDENLDPTLINQV